MFASYKGRITTTTTGDTQTDAYGRMRIGGSDVVESITFASSNHGLAINTSFTGTASASVNVPAAALRLSVGTASGDSSVVQTKRYFRYVPGISHLIDISGTMGAPKANVRQRWGYFDSNNGLFFEQTSTDLKIVVRTGTSGTPVDNAVSRTNWNLDKLDGTGPSKITLDTSKHNLYVIDFTWHGAGRVRFGIHIGGQVIYCHEVEGGNVANVPFMRRPSLPVRVELTNTGTAASSTTLDFVTFAFVQESTGKNESSYVFSHSTKTTSKSINNTTPLPLISIRPATTFAGAINRIPVRIEQVELLTVQDSIYYQVLINPTLTGGTWSSVHSFSSVEVNTGATAVTGGTILFEGYVPGGGKGATALGQFLSQVFISLDIAGTTPELITLAAAKLNGNSDTFAEIAWSEFQ